MQLYLLSIRELLETAGNAASNGKQINRENQEDSLREKALQKLDAHRMQKVRKLKAPSAANQAIGAGLLLQLAVQTRGREITGRILTVSEVLSILHEPMQIDYHYDVHGKPDFADTTWHFNLSHSGEYVCLVTDEAPVGVDIQQMRPLKNYHLAEKYFSKGELTQLEACESQAEKEACFYRIWVQKEAYAKFTGEGIARAVSLDTRDIGSQVSWWMPDGPKGYQLAVCSSLRDKTEICG